MKRRIRRGIAAAAAVIAASTAIFLGNTGGAAAAAPSLPAFGLVGDGTTMTAFYTNTPSVLNWVADFVGFSGCDTRLVGFDFRPADGLLYGVGDCPTYAGIYTIPTRQNPDLVMPLTRVGQLSVALVGTSFGVDFNPAADRLRIISDNGQNLRHNVDGNSTISDVPLTFDRVLAKGVTGAAYTNNDNNADTATTLFDIDTLNDQVVIQGPANNGTLSPTGKLGVDATINAGFDIFAELSNGKTVSNTAFATLLPAGVGGRQTLYMVDVLTGTATPIARFPSIAPVTDVAVALDVS